jgi:hypothetical protein
METTFFGVLFFAVILTIIAGNKLHKKHRSLHWLWFALISGWIPLIISIVLSPKVKDVNN